MKTCCQDLQEIKCSIPDIQNRISPIEYVNGVLVVNTSISVETSLTIGGAQISTETGHINLPTRTLINGVPLLSGAFATDVINLPTNTMFNGYAPTTEQYFYFFTSSNSSFDLNPNPVGYMINGTSLATRAPSVDLRGFPFIAPENCVLTSLKLMYIIVPGSGPITQPTNGLISLDVVDKNLNPFFTGISYTIIPPLASSSRTSLQSQFEYYLQKGDSVGIYVSGSAAQFGGGVCIYATLGYKIIPPTLLLAPLKAPTQKSLRQSNTSSLYNRFPFNNIMNSYRKTPVRFEDQLDALQSNKNSSHALYGRTLTSQDYELRSTIPKGIPTAYQDSVAFIFNNSKQEGYFIDFSSKHQNTLQLEKKCDWTGLLFGASEQQEERPLSVHIPDDPTSIDYDEVFRQNSAPTTIDFLSFDLDDPYIACNTFERFFSIFDSYTFNFVVVKHNGDPNIQSRTGNILLFYQYTRLFVNVMIEKDHEWIVSEDWYVHPDLIASYGFIQEIIDNVDNIDNILSTKCVQIISSAYNN
jgi:hypothetical protein